MNRGTGCEWQDGSDSSYEYAVVGAGPAGVAAARFLARNAGPGKVVLLGDEDCVPYERPALSKAALRPGGEAVPRICSDEEFESIGLEFRRGHEVIRICREERWLQTTAGGIRYGALLLATGASPTRLNIPGGHLAQVFYLRRAADAEALRTALARRPRTVIVGGGFIGLEVAATARAIGCEVLVVTKSEFLMNRCLPATMAQSVALMLQARGIAFRFGVGPLAVEGISQVEAVRLDTGERIPADVLVVGIGATPNCGLALAAGLEVDDGVVVDEHWRTSDSHIFAAGDVARRRLPDARGVSRGVRLESWEPAEEHGELAAAAMLGIAAEPPGVPWMWSDQDDVNIQIAGHPDPAAPLVLRQAAGECSSIGVFLDDGRITGAITVNDGRSMPLLRRAIQEQRQLDGDLLADPGVGLRQALGMRRRT